MRHTTRRLPALLLACALLAGCQGSPEDRINAAVPLSAEATAAHAAMLALGKDDPSLAEGFEQEFGSRLKVRAIECAKGYAPGTFADDADIKAAIGNAECFAAADAKLAQWLGRKRIAVMLAMPPLRALPAAPVDVIAGEQGMARVEFADAAGVAALHWRGHVRVVDVANGTAILDAATPIHGVVSLSDNGRVLALGDNDGLVQVLRADTGEALLTLSEVRGGKVFWLGRQGLAYGSAKGDGLVVLDLSTENDTTLPLGNAQPETVLPVPAMPGTYVVATRSNLAQIVLAERTAPRLVRELALSPGEWSVAGRWTLGANGKLMKPHGSQVQLVDPATFASTELDFAPLHLSWVVATGDPDTIVLSVMGPGQVGLFVYSFSQRTLAKVATPGAGGLDYHPALKRYSVRDQGRILLMPQPQTEAPAPIDPLLETLAFEAAIAKAQQATRMEQFRERAQDRRATDNTRDTYTPVRTPNVGRTVDRADGRIALTDAVRNGALRLGNEGDLARWKRAYEAKVGRAVPKRFDEWIRYKTVYVIQRDFTVPANLTGSNSVVFVVEMRAPFPRGDVTHSPILDVKSGGCQGGMCRLMLREE